jgi:hypothetical protein
MGRDRPARAALAESGIAGAPLPHYALLFLLIKFPVDSSPIMPRNLRQGELWCPGEGKGPQAAHRFLVGSG